MLRPSQRIVVLVLVVEFAIDQPKFFNPIRYDLNRSIFTAAFLHSSTDSQQTISKVFQQSWQECPYDMLVSPGVIGKPDLYNFS